MTGATTMKKKINDLSVSKKFSQLLRGITRKLGVWRTIKWVAFLNSLNRAQTCTVGDGSVKIISSPHWFRWSIENRRKNEKITKTGFSFRTVIAPASSDPEEFILFRGIEHEHFSRGTDTRNIKFAVQTALDWKKRYRIMIIKLILKTCVFYEVIVSFC